MVRVNDEEAASGTSWLGWLADTVTEHVNSAASCTRRLGSISSCPVPLVTPLEDHWYWMVRMVSWLS